MISLRVLGSSGSTGEDKYTTCLQVTPHTLIDAGNIVQALGENIVYINNIFLSHSHLDHILDCAYLIDSTLNSRKKTLVIYGLEDTIKIVKKNIFNWDIWPDFSQIKLPNSSNPSLIFKVIEPGKKYIVENDISLTPFYSNHTVACCGYVISSKTGSILFSADTYKNPKIWNILNSDKQIKAAIVDVSFPNDMANIARESKHLTPQILKEELKLLKRDNINIYVNHLKPVFDKKVREDLKKIGFDSANILEDGDVIFYKDGSRRSCYSREKDKIDKLNKIGILLSSQSSLDSLLEQLVFEAKNLTNADGVTLYLLNKEKLEFKVVETDSLGIKSGVSDSNIKWPPLSLYINDKPNYKMVAVTCALKGKIINIEDVYSMDNFDFSGTREFDRSTGYRSKSILVVPLKNYEGNVIGVLQLINKIDYFRGEVESFDKDDESITSSLASQAAVAISNNMLIRDLEKLIEAFLKGIIYAISKKSKHTSGHIKRMVKLSMMMARAIDQDDSIYKDKHYNEEMLKQINLAALIHDIGKLSIPEYILDKSKKLEDIYDGLDFIRFRIELIKKELQIAVLNGDLDEVFALEEAKKLDKYFYIMSDSNEGKEYTPDENIKIFKELSKKIYKLNGLVYKVLTEEECEKLSVRRGTLTEKEREIINNHAKITLGILEKIAFPKKYKDITEIASNHHEKINGKGYPRGLKGDEISFESRILAIADIFEALTASDRPYKKANPLSTAMNILYKMAKEGDLDKELVKFFYTSGLYLEYAKKFLPKKSIDNVDLDIEKL